MTASRSLTAATKMERIERPRPPRRAASASASLSSAASSLLSLFRDVRWSSSLARSAVLMSVDPVCLDVEMRTRKAAWLAGRCGQRAGMQSDRNKMTRRAGHSSGEAFMQLVPTTSAARLRGAATAAPRTTWHRPASGMAATFGRKRVEVVEDTQSLLDDARSPTDAARRLDS